MTSFNTSESLPREGLAATYDGFEAIATGGAGIVFKARDRVLQRTVAIKLMLPALMRYRTQLDRTVAEARAMAAIDHPNVVRVYTAGRITLTTTDCQILLDGFAQLGDSVVIPKGDCKTVYIAMEWIDGGTVQDLIEREQVTQYRAGDIVDQLLSALEAVHAGGSIHRDVKAPNLLLTADGTVKLTDFGIVRSSSNGGLTRQGVVMGTPWYIAPEQARDSASVDHRVDLYAAGVLLHVLLVGMGNSGIRGQGSVGGGSEEIRERLEFFCDAVAAAEEEDSSGFWRDVPQGAREFIAKATAADPEKRFQSAEEMRKALNRIKLDLRINLTDTAFHTIVAPDDGGGITEAQAFVTDAPDQGDQLVPVSEPVVARRPRRTSVAIIAAVVVILAVVLGVWIGKSPELTSSPLAFSTSSPQGEKSIPEMDLSSAEPPRDGKKAKVAPEADPEPAIVEPVVKPVPELVPQVQEPVAVVAKVEATASPPKPTKPEGFSITVSGETKVWLGSHTLPATVPAGSYELFAQFEGGKRRKVLDNPVEVAGPGVVKCHTVSEICVWQPK